MRKVEKEVIEVLNNESEMTAPEIAEKTKHAISYIYETLYRLELKGVVERVWKFGAWYWRLRR